MIIESGVYRDGRRREVPISLAATAQALQRDPDVFAWVDLYEPDPNEMASVRRLFGFHLLAIEDAGIPHQRPKVERYDDSLFVVLRTLWYVDDENAVETGQVSVFVGDRTVVTVWHGARDQLFAARDLARSMPSVLVHGPTAVLWAVCDTVVDRYQAVTRSVMNDVDEIEAAVFATRCTSEAERIYMLKREVLEMRRAIAPLRDPLGEFSHGGAHLSSSAAPFFRDVANYVARACEQIDSAEALLDSALAAHTARVAVQQNDDLRRISAWVAIAAVPTLVAGIYGMNFDRMPELHWEYSYPIVILSLIGSCVVLFRGFRRAGWL
jgi:magnesium transporter